MVIAKTASTLWTRALAQALKAGVTASTETLGAATAQAAVSESEARLVATGCTKTGPVRAAAVKAKIDGGRCGQFAPCAADDRSVCAKEVGPLRSGLKTRISSSDVSKRELPSLANGYLDRLHGIMQQLVSRSKR